jgi:starch synthase
MDGIPDEDVKVLENPDFVNYNKAIINMADGVICGSKQINKDVLKYAEKSNKPLLAFQNSDTYIDAYSQLYDQVIDK